jgi:DNA modification methylase
MICNYGSGGRFVLIDGNSRREDAKTRKEKWVWISLPSRKLTPQEFREMSAMFDFAKAGEVDIERIERDLGDKKSFFDKWKMIIPTRVLDTIGKKATISAEDFRPEKEKEKDAKAKVSVILREKFIEPPFSVLDTKNGNWQERKRQWLELGLKGELGRGDDITYNLAGTPRANGKPWGVTNSKVKQKTLTQSIPIKKYDTMDEYYSKESQELNTSIFDPALCELMYAWFCPKKGVILDPFAGGSVRGIVAHYLNYQYWGIDLSRKQIEANRKQGIEILKKNNQPTWYDGDSDKVLDKKWTQKFDFVFSCPPYFDLEVYSKNADDLSNMKSSDFLVKYQSIITKSVKLLKPKRYACFVVSQVRDKKGYYQNLVAETVQAFEKAGAKFYNDAVLLNMVGSASMRADRQFSSSKKLVRTHQNVLVFYKP